LRVKLALRLLARQSLQPAAVSGCEDYAQIERRYHFGRRRSAAFENLVEQASVCARAFRPRGLAAGLLDFTPQQSDDVVQFEDLHISPCIVGGITARPPQIANAEYEIVTSTIAPPIAPLDARHGRILGTVVDQSRFDVLLIEDNNLTT
jgi:hypothetical protein